MGFWPSGFVVGVWPSVFVVGVWPSGCRPSCYVHHNRSGTSRVRRERSTHSLRRSVVPLLRGRCQLQLVEGDQMTRKRLQFDPESTS